MDKSKLKTLALNQKIEGIKLLASGKMRYKIAR
jgi:hypothetical protein